MRIIQWFMMAMLFTGAGVSGAAELPKIRAAYWGVKPIEAADAQMAALQAAGLNAALVKDMGFAIQVPLWQAWGERAQARGILLLPVINFAGTEEIKQANGAFRPHVAQDGAILSNTPCPLDEAYWERMIAQRFMQLAQTPSLAGMLFDTEMYGSDMRTYHDPCFCDACWQAFFETMNAPAPDCPSERRFECLQERQLAAQYEQAQEDRLQAILARIEQRVHAAKPDLLLGIVAYQKNWFYRGLLRGLGTPQRPALVFSETSYVLGFTPHVTRERADIRALSGGEPAARHIPGLWLGRFFPNELPSQCAALARESDGYWLFTADSLWAKTPPVGDYALHGAADEYWAALRQANDETRQAALPPVPQASFYDATPQKLITQPSLAAFLLKMSPQLQASAAAERRRMASPILFRGKALLHGVKSPSQAAVIRVTHVPVGQYQDDTQYTLFDAQGNLLERGALNARQPSRELTLPPDMAGNVSLLLESGANAAQADFAAMPFVIEASPTFPLATLNTAHLYSFFAARPPAHLRAHCVAPEAAFVVIQAADGQAAQQHEITGLTEIEISTPPETVGEIGIAPAPMKPFDDVVFYFYNHEFPYLLPE